MKAAFLLVIVVLFVVLGAISVALFRYSRRAWLICGSILLVGFLLLWRPISDFMDPWFLGSVGEVSVSDVISAREFTVRGWVYMERHIVLAGTRLPNTQIERDAAKAELLRLLGEKKRVTLAFPQTVRRMPEPWPAIVLSGGVPVNERMLASAFLLSDGTTLGQTSASAEVEGRGNAARRGRHKRTAAGPDAGKPGQPGKGAASGRLPTWGRYLLWVLAGFFGATALGMIMNKRYQGLPFLLLIAGLAVRSIVLSSRSGATVWPPIVCLIIIVLFAGGGRMANKQFLEEHPGFRR